MKIGIKIDEQSEIAAARFDTVNATKRRFVRRRFDDATLNTNKCHSASQRSVHQKTRGNFKRANLRVMLSS